MSDDPEDCIVTVLGSCIATCLYDPVAKVGGANHFLVANGPKTVGQSLRYGVHAMELLINALLRKGARRDCLVAKVFGGAKMFDDMADIGRVNAEFALQFLSDEAIPLQSKSLLGRQARRIRFWPSSGRALQRVVDPSELRVMPPAPIEQSSTAASDVTLF